MIYYGKILKYSFHTCFTSKYFLLFFVVALNDRLSCPYIKGCSANSYLKSPICHYQAFPYIFGFSRACSYAAVYGCLYMKIKDTRNGHEEKGCRKNIWRKSGANHGKQQVRAEGRLGDGYKNTLSSFVFLRQKFNYNVFFPFPFPNPPIFPPQLPFKFMVSFFHCLFLQVYVLSRFKCCLFRHFLAFSLLGDLKLS